MYDGVGWQCRTRLEKAKYSHISEPRGNGRGEFRCGDVPSLQRERLLQQTPELPPLYIHTKRELELELWSACWWCGEC
jgi:hypothetical protein